MRSKNDLPSSMDEKATAPTMSRRAAGKRLLAGMAIGVAAPWISAGHPIWKHFDTAELLERAESTAAGNKLLFLSEEQFKSLAAAAETIVPGSTKAGVAKFIDLLLSVESSKNQREFLGSVAEMEEESAKRFSKNVARLSPSERNELFTAMSTSGGSPATDSSAPKAFLHLREWIAGSYYSSEIGMRELGWMPDRVFAEFPGCSSTGDGH